MATHNDVAHNWAHQTGKARNNQQMFYEGPTIYSYGRHFPIARFLTPETVLFTSKGYSSSTSGHKALVKRAIPPSVTVFTVNNVEARCTAQHLENYEVMIKSAVADLEAAGRARTRATYFVDLATALLDEANLYARHFKLGVKKIALKNLNGAFDDIQKRAEALRAEAEFQRAKLARERTLKERGRLLQWCRGEDVVAPHTRVPYVRVKDDTVETSWGARVPLPDALSAWGAMKAARAGKSIPAVSKVGDFAVQQVTSIGIRVGCHFVPFKVAQFAAAKIGLD